MYNAGGRFVKTYSAGTLVVPYGRWENQPTQTGNNYLDHMRIYCLRDSGQNYLSETAQGDFVDCRIRLNSMNPPVYGRGF